MIIFALRYFPSFTEALLSTLYCVRIFSSGEKKKETVRLLLILNLKTNIRMLNFVQSYSTGTRAAWSIRMNVCLETRFAIVRRHVKFKRDLNSSFGLNLTCRLNSREADREVSNCRNIFNVESIFNKSCRCGSIVLEWIVSASKSRERRRKRNLRSCVEISIAVKMIQAAF